MRWLKFMQKSSYPKNQTAPACCWWVRIMDGDSSGLQLRLCKNQGNLPWKNRAGADARHLPYQQKDGALPADKRACSLHRYWQENPPVHHQYKRCYHVSYKSVNPNRKNSRHRPGITQRAGTKAASPKRWPYGNGQIWISPKAERSFRTFLPWKCSPTAMCWVSPKQAGLPAITITPWRIGAITVTSDTLKSVVGIWFPNHVCWIFCLVLIFWTAIDLLKSWLTLRKNSADRANRQKSPPPNECNREKQRPPNVKRRTLFL